MLMREVSRIRMVVVVSAFAIGVSAVAAGKWEIKLSPGEQRALAAITPVSLQAHLSFLSADALEGRGSGSSGLDVAAEYIAAQFRRAGLKAVGDDGFFQTTPRTRLTPNLDGFQCRMSIDGRLLDVPSRQFALVGSPAANTPAVREIRIDEAPVIKVPFGGAAAAAYDALPPGPTTALFTARLAPPVETDAPQRNVIGLLPGSDPKLADTYVLVTAHYDGQGSRPGPDRVWNSANDNGSGTVTVIEIAAALASLSKHPRRSLVFIAFHGEESGLAGSRYHAQHPVFPLEKTVAGINVEMVGRTDDIEGDQRKRASVTGFDYSDVGEVFRRAGEQTGVTVFKHPKNSDPYFGASDNAALAIQGVPAHTV